MSLVWLRPCKTKKCWRFFSRKKECGKKPAGGPVKVLAVKLAGIGFSKRGKCVDPGGSPGGHQGYWSGKKLKTVSFGCSMNFKAGFWLKSDTNVLFLGRFNK